MGATVANIGYHLYISKVYTCTLSAEEPEGKQPYYGDKPPPKEDPKKIDIILDRINSQEGYGEHFFEDFDFAQSQLSEIGIDINRESFEQISRERSLDSLQQ